MPVRIVHSKQNSRLKQLRRALTDPPRGVSGDAVRLAGIEGPNLLHEALRAGLKIETVFIAEGFEGLLADLGLPDEVEIVQLPKALLDSALTTEAPQPAAALIRPADWVWRDFFEGGIDGSRTSAPFVVVLAGIQDPGNLGTILRSAEAFGASGAIALPGTVSAWNPKAVRASAGSIFRLPLLEAGADSCFSQLRAAGIRTLSTAVRNAQAATTADLAAPTALLIGNESNGVSAELAGRCDGAVTIPLPGPVESLNAAVAAGILLYEAARQRATR